MWNSNPIVEAMPNGLFQLTVNFKCVMPWSDDTFREVVEIPRGYVTNFATMPALARVLVSPIDPDIIRASVVHDFLTQEFFPSRSFQPVVKRYVSSNLASHRHDTLIENKRLDWNEAAFLMRRMMKAEGAPAWKRGIVYAGVRIYGWIKGKK